MGMDYVLLKTVADKNPNCLLSEKYLALKTVTGVWRHYELRYRILGTDELMCKKHVISNRGGAPYISCWDSFIWSIAFYIINYRNDKSSS